MDNKFKGEMASKSLAANMTYKPVSNGMYELVFTQGNVH